MSAGALEVGSVFARLSSKLDAEGFAKFDRHVDRAEQRTRKPLLARLGGRHDDSGFQHFEKRLESARRQKAVEAKLGGHVDPRAFQQFEHQLERSRRMVADRKAFRAALGAEYDGRAFQTYERQLQTTHASSKRAEDDTRSIGKAFGGMARRAAMAGGAIGGAYLSFEAAKGAIDATVELAHDTEILAKATGMSTREASAWVGVAKARAISTRQLTMSFATLSKNVVTATGADKAHADTAAQAAKADEARVAASRRLEAAQIRLAEAQRAEAKGGSSQAAVADRVKLAQLGVADAEARVASAGQTMAQKISANQELFKKMGVSTEELRKHQTDFHWILGAVADGLRKLPAGAERTAAAQKLLGRGWQGLMPIMAEGKRGVDENLRSAAKYGDTLSGNLGPKIRRLHDDQIHLKEAQLGLQIQFTEHLAPALMKGAELMLRWVVEIEHGKGTVGSFVSSVAQIVRWVAEATLTVGKFVAKTPGLRQIAEAAVAVAVGIKAWRFAKQISELQTIYSWLIRLKNARAGEAVASDIAGSKGIGGVEARAKGPFKRFRDWLVGSSVKAGEEAGAAEGAAQVEGGIGSKFMGKFRRSFATMKRWLLGASATAGAEAGVAEGEAMTGSSGLLSGGVKGSLKNAGTALGGLLGKVLGGVAVASIIAQLAGIQNADPLLFLHPPAAGDPRPGHGDILPNVHRGAPPSGYVWSSTRAGYVERVTSSGYGRPVPVGSVHRAQGGPVGPPGSFGGGDRRHIVAEDGEFVLRKEAVAKHGVDQVHAWNAGENPAATAMITAASVLVGAARSLGSSNPLSAVTQEGARFSGMVNVQRTAFFATGGLVTPSARFSPTTASAGVHLASTDIGGSELAQKLADASRKAIETAKQLKDRASQHVASLRKSVVDDASALHDRVTDRFQATRSDATRASKGLHDDVLGLWSKTDSGVGDHLTSIEGNVSKRTAAARKSAHDASKGLHDDVTKQFAATDQDVDARTKSVESNTSSRFQAARDAARKAASTMAQAVSGSYSSLDSAVSTGTDYVERAADAALKGLGAKALSFSIPKPPAVTAKERGGFLPGTGREDSIHVLAAPNEFFATRHMQPHIQAGLALAKMAGLSPYGSLEELEQLDTPHHMARGGFPRIPRAVRRARGGYTSPFGGGYTVGRTDMGVDVSLTPGEPIRAIGDARVIGTLANWYAGQPFLWYQLLGGPDRGRYVYVAEQITRLARPGSMLHAGDPVAYYAASGTGIETGWATASGQTLAQGTTGYKEGQVTPAGSNYAAFLAALGVHGAHGGGAYPGVTVPTIGAPRVKGPRGPLLTIAQQTLGKVTGAANQYLQSHAPMGAAGAAPVGGIMALAQAAAKAAGVPWVASIVRTLLSKESSGGQNLAPSGPLAATGPFQVIPGTFRSFAAAGHTNIRSPWDNALAAFRYIKATYGTLQNLAARTGLLGSGYHGYARGGYVRRPRARLPRASMGRAASLLRGPRIPKPSPIRGLGDLSRFARLPALSDSGDVPQLASLDQQLSDNQTWYGELERILNLQDPGGLTAADYTQLERVDSARVALLQNEEYVAAHTEPMIATGLNQRLRARTVYQRRAGRDQSAITRLQTRLTRDERVEATAQHTRQAHAMQVAAQLAKKLSDNLKKIQDAHAQASTTAGAWTGRLRAAKNNVSRVRNAWAARIANAKWGDQKAALRRQAHSAIAAAQRAVSAISGTAGQANANSRSQISKLTGENRSIRTELAQRRRELAKDGFDSAWALQQEKWRISDRIAALRADEATSNKAISGLDSEISQFEAADATLQGRLHELPYNIRDAQLDLEDLGATATAATSAAAGDATNLQALYDQAQQQLAVVTKTARIDEAALRTFRGPGDIGVGAQTAFAGASDTAPVGVGGGPYASPAAGGPQIIIQTLHPGDIRTLHAVAQAANQGNALSPYVPASRTQLRI